MTESIYNALGNPIRAHLLVCLEKEAKTVSELVSKCHLSQSAVSQHLSKLRSAGLVATVRQGRHVYYHLQDKCVAHIAKIVTNYAEGKKSKQNTLDQ